MNKVVYTTYYGSTRKYFPMNMQWHDVVGILGVGCILIAYLMLQIGRYQSTMIRFSVLNGVGAALILISLMEAFNLSAFLIEIFWLAISVYGVVVNLKRRKIQSSAKSEQ